jgi:DNA-binding LytR/AlgR family response regulator
MINILLIDDDALVAEKTKFIAKELDSYTIKDIAYNYKTAIDLLDNYFYDLAIVDINLEEERSGFDLAKILNEKSIPFLFLTSYSDQDTLTKAIAFNPVGYVVKPVKKENLFAHLEMLRIKFIETDNIVVLDGKKEIPLKASHIYSIKSDGNYCEIKTIKETLLLRGKLAVWPFKSNIFVRFHKSYVVNTTMIE